jgi:hypothetical protein
MPQRTAAEKTTFSALFMKSAIQPCSDGHRARHG